jgi:hypothetical protein
MSNEEMTVFLIKLNMCYESRLRIVSEQIDRSGIKNA